MFDFQQRMMIQNSAPMGVSPERLAILGARQSYQKARKLVWLHKLRNWILHKPAHLYDLNDLRKTINVTGIHHAGKKTVLVDQIRGSEGRSMDFDSGFHPINESNRGRWINIAVVHLLGQSLPAPELIQVGNIYFVRDGHHRISVAKTVGQYYMEANVTVWETNDKLPWEPSDLNYSLNHASA